MWVCEKDCFNSTTSQLFRRGDIEKDPGRLPRGKQGEVIYFRPISEAAAQAKREEPEDVSSRDRGAITKRLRKLGFDGNITEKMSIEDLMTIEKEYKRGTAQKK
jgi:hypothetical protein